MSNQYQLTLCELFHPKIYGMDEFSDSHILTHFIVLHSYSFQEYRYLELTDSDDDSTEYDYQEENEVQSFMNMIYKDIQYIHRKTRYIPKEHPIIRNYLNIRKKGLRIEISENIILQSGEKVSIIKTIWIRIIQRKWKKVYRQYRSYLWRRYLCVLRGETRFEPRLNLLRGLLTDLL
jgi:hypothetical protein